MTIQEEAQDYQVEAERDDFQIEERAPDLFRNKMLSLEEIEAEVTRRV